MATVTISSKFQVVIPKAIRKELGLLPGHKVQAIVCGERIMLIPFRPMEQLRGPGWSSRPAALAKPGARATAVNW